MKAMLITSTPDHPLLKKILFQVLKFEESQIVWADPEKPIQFVRVDPDVIIPIGEQALNKLDMFGITRLAGLQQEYGECPVVPVMAPGYIQKNPHLLERFAKDFHRAYEVGMGLGKMEMTNSYIYVTDITQVLDMVAGCRAAGYCSLDFETTSLDTLKTYDPDFYVTMMSITFQQGSSYVVPMFHKDSPNDPVFIAQILSELEREVFRNPDITLIAHNCKFELHCLTRLGIPIVIGPIHDTMTMHHVLDEHSSHKLKDLVRWYNPRYANYESTIGEYKNWADIPVEKLAKYNALDSDLTFRLYWQFTEMLLDDERLYILYRNLISASAPALFAMEQRGMRVDKAHIIKSIDTVEKMLQDMEQEMHNVSQVTNHGLAVRDRMLDEYIAKLEKREQNFQERDTIIRKHMSDRLEKMKARVFKTEKAKENHGIKIVALEKEMKEYKHEKLEEVQKIIESYYDYTIDPEDYIKPEEYMINFASPLQVKALLYDKTGFNFPIQRDQWDRPMPSTGKEVLELLPDKSGFVDNLLAYRQLGKVLGTYLKGILEKVDDKHNVHGTFNQHGTKTGRLSASDPNLQNIIKRTKFKKVEEAVEMVMKSFIPPRGMNIMQADFSQAELRIIAHYAGEKNMLAAYNNGEDLHALTAATTMGMSLEKFKALPDKEFKRYRYEAKSTNFGFIYIMSAEGFREYARTNYGIKISLKQAKDRREKFFKQYPKLLTYHKTYIAKAKKYGYVRTLFGRKVRLPDIYSNEQVKVGHAERNAVNAPIQGTAGEMMIFALALLYHRAPWLKLVNTVHDSALCYTPPSPGREIAIIKETMENLPTMEYFGKEIDSVDMVVDFEASSSSWGELKEI